MTGFEPVTYATLNYHLSTVLHDVHPELENIPGADLTHKFIILLYLAHQS